MTMKLPAGLILVRNLCRDATSDIRHNVLQPADWCTMSATRISGGYNYKKVCQDETATGTVIGDFNSAYDIEESRASMHIFTPTPAGGVQARQNAMLTICGSSSVDPARTFEEHVLVEKLKEYLASAPRVLFAAIDGVKNTFDLCYGVPIALIDKRCFSR